MEQLSLLQDATLLEPQFKTKSGATFLLPNALPQAKALPLRDRIPGLKHRIIQRDLLQAHIIPTRRPSVLSILVLPPLTKSNQKLELDRISTSGKYTQRPDTWNRRMLTIWSASRWFMLGQAAFHRRQISPSMPGLVLRVSNSPTRWC